MTVVLGALAIFVGIAAVFGFQQISEQAQARAEKVAGEHMTKLLTEKTIQEMVRSLLEKERDQLSRDIIVETPLVQDNGEAVGQPYPGEGG